MLIIRERRCSFYLWFSSVHSLMSPTGSFEKVDDSTEQYKTGVKRVETGLEISVNKECVEQPTVLCLRQRM